MDTTIELSVDSSLYEHDLHEWCVAQAARLRERSLPVQNDGLDCANLAEEIKSFGRSQRREIKSRLRVLLTHLLKWRHQPSSRSNSSRSTIREQRHEIVLVLDDSPSLANFAGSAIGTAYPKAVVEAAFETGLPRSGFAMSCPFSEQQVFDLEFLPTDLDGPATL